MFGLAFALALAGCAGGPRIAGPDRDPLDRPGTPQAVAVVAARYAPEPELILADSVVGSGAGVGAQVGDAIGRGALVAGPAGLAFWLAAMAVGAIAGAGVGAAADAIEAPKEASLVALRAMAAAAVAESQRIPAGIAQEAAAAAARFTPYRVETPVGIGPSSRDDAPDYRGLAAQGFGAVVEIRVARTGYLAARGREPGAASFVAVEARLVDPGKGQPTWMRGLVLIGPFRALSEWKEGGEALLQGDVAKARREAGERIVDDLLLHAEAFVGPHRKPAPLVCGVLATFPPVESTWVPPDRPTAADAPVPLTPVLAWKPLPESIGLYGNIPWPDASKRFYDLRIWRFESERAGPMVYERFGLREPRHEVESPLDPGTAYAWSIRLRYVEDGRPRATRWSALNSHPGALSRALLPQQFHARLEDGRPVPVACVPDEMLPCGCLDDIPWRDLYTFRTSLVAAPATARTAPVGEAPADSRPATP